MLSSVARFVKRLAVLVPGLVIAYLSIFNIFPWLNEHLPLVAALIVTYVLAAYVLIPAAIRLLRIIFPARHLPLYCITRDGFASDPLNIALVGTRTEVTRAMTAAGWYRADDLSFKSALRIGLSTVYGWSYPRGPISSLYLFGRKQDLGFQIPITDGATGSRHHVRFWAATYQDGEAFSAQSIHWQNRQAHIRDDRLLWVGAASRDIGVTFIRHNAQLTHLVDPDTDGERELIVSQLRTASIATVDKTVKLGDPYKLLNIRGLGGHLRTDGRMTIMKIKPQTVTTSSGS